MRLCLLITYIAFVLTFAPLARAGVTTSTVAVECKPKPMPSPKKPAAGERATVEVEGAKFFQRFLRDETDGKAQLGTGGILTNDGKKEIWVRVCIVFAAGDDSWIYVEMLETQLGAGETKTVMPLRQVPAEQIGRINACRMSLHVSSEPFTR